MNAIALALKRLAIREHRYIFYRIACQCGPVEVALGAAGLSIRCPTCTRQLQIPQLSVLRNFPQVERTAGIPVQVPLRAIFSWTLFSATVLAVMRHITRNDPREMLYLAIGGATLFAVAALLAKAIYEYRRR